MLESKASAGCYPLRRHWIGHEKKTSGGGGVEIMSVP